MMKYRKLPIEVHAWPVGELIHQYYNDAKNLPDEVKLAFSKRNLRFLTNSIHVTTLEGEHIAKVSDVLVRGIRGEFYGCREDIFKETYEKV
jgi:hypothetical protein